MALLENQFPSADLITQDFVDAWHKCVTQGESLYPNRVEGDAGDPDYSLMIDAGILGRESRSFRDDLMAILRSEGVRSLEDFYEDGRAQVRRRNTCKNKICARCTDLVASLNGHYHDDNHVIIVPEYRLRMPLTGVNSRKLPPRPKTALYPVVSSVAAAQSYLDRCAEEGWWEIERSQVTDPLYPPQPGHWDQIELSLRRLDGRVLTASFAELLLLRKVKQFSD